jgi:hypothetical protein
MFFKVNTLTLKNPSQVYLITTLMQENRAEKPFICAIFLINTTKGLGLLSTLQTKVTNHLIIKYK